MNNRELWINIMEYRNFDRVPVIHWCGWDETYANWRRQGMPENVDEHEYFQAAGFWENPTHPIIPEYLAPFPAYERKTIEQQEDYLLRQNEFGVIEKVFHNKSSLPLTVGSRLRDADDWPEYKKRLLPDAGRLPKNLDRFFTKKDSCAKAITISSGMGWIRNWMGVENMCYLAYDDPGCFADIVNTLADLTCWFLDAAIAEGMPTPDACLVWEDISGKTGPLISPGIFKRLVAPGYRKMRDKLDHHGIKYMCVDTDGDADALLGPFMDAGINMLLPVEVGTWGESPERIRQKYGKELRLIGGFDKLVLEKGRKEIDAEINRHLELLSQGGYLIMPDHLITPDTPLDNYRYYLDRVREIRF